jgi:hypothetical protein
VRKLRWTLLLQREGELKMRRKRGKRRRKEVLAGTRVACGGV